MLVCMATQSERTASARSRLIAAASDLVAANGSANASLLEIGERAGMSRGAVNFHFGSKVALLEAVFAQASRECLQDSVLPDDLAALFLESHRAWFESTAGARFIPMLFAEGLATQAPALRAPLVALCHAWRVTILQSLQHLELAGGVRPDLDLQVEAALIVASLLGLVAQRMADPDFDLEGAYAVFGAAATARLQAPGAARSSTQVA